MLSFIISFNIFIGTDGLSILESDEPLRLGCAAPCLGLGLPLGAFHKEDLTTEGGVQRKDKGQMMKRNFFYFDNEGRTRKMGECAGTPSMLTSDPSS